MDALSSRLTQRGSPFELENILIKDIPCRVFTKGPQSLNHLYRRAAMFGQREYLVTSTERWTFNQVVIAASTFATKLQDNHNVRAGQRIALILPNCPQWIVAFMAITSLGATAVIIHCENAYSTIAEAIKISKCALAIGSAKLEEQLSATDTNCPFLCVDSSVESSYGATTNLIVRPENFTVDVPRSSAAQLTSITCDPEAETLIAFTSGTTGEPKGAIFTHRNLITGLMNMMLGAALSGARSSANASAPKAPPAQSIPCSILLSPFSHISGYAQLLLMLYLGGKIVSVDWNTTTVLKYISEEKVRSITGASVQMLRDVLRADQSQFDICTLANFHLHGEALHSGLTQEIYSALPHASISTGYGMTETCGSICVAVGEELKEKPWSSGRILPSIDVKLTSPSGEPAPTGESGEIYVRGAMCLQGYCRPGGDVIDPKQNGWLPTGDVGKLDECGNLYVVDRVKDTLTYEGTQISSAHLERVARSHTSLEDAAVVGISHADSAAITLAVLPKSDAIFDKPSLLKHIANSLELLKPSIRILLCQNFPRTVSGKIDRRTLREQLSLAYPDLQFE